LERLERLRPRAAIEEFYRRCGEALDRLTDHDMARLIVAITEAARPADGDPGGEFEGFAAVFGADPEKAAGLSEAAQAGVGAWRAAGGCEAWAFGEEALGGYPQDEELARAGKTAREKHCRPAFHKARARPYLRGLPWAG
jgi:hypothetical protein